ncbi:MAG: DNA recombination protein RmuC [Bacteroidales bacterium]|jgi:DNA recombination protein RmuC|nr:DNA recombination protein RmuC [Bacteroidales bacterium]
MESMIYIVSGATLIFGAAIAWLFAQSRNASSRRALEKELDLNRERLSTAIERINGMEKSLEEERAKGTDLGRQLAVAGEREKSLKEQYDNYKQEVEKLQEKFKLEFENIATKILKENTADFSEFNRKSITEVVSPLKEKIDTFQKTVNETYEKGLKERSGLKVEIEKLVELNQRISEEANNLTRALKVDSKQQGNWGEMILDRLLERSGLLQGEEYEKQKSYRNDKNELIKPDVVVNLPDNKHIIIDSKVSLTAYEAFVNAESEEDKERSVKAHIHSVREHVKFLAEKNYHLADKLDTPDFVLLFMPLESAFSLAVQETPDLFSYAWEKQIVIVSPTTLLATLMTVGSIWKHEKQTRNTERIADEGGKLYDKFVLFLDDLENLGKHISRTQKTWEEAHNKLVSGRGNVIGKVEKLRKLGAKTTKSIPNDLLPDNDGGEEDE